MKCPVCEKVIKNTAQKCSNCGFEDLRTEFINENELEMWRTYVVYPCRFAYQTSLIQMKALKKDLEKEIELIKIVQQKNEKATHDNCKDIMNNESPTFKKPVIQKDEGWYTKNNIKYKTFYEGGWSTWVKCEISNLVLDFVGNRVTVNFLIKKTYDDRGPTSTQQTGFIWKLKDDYGIVVADGTWKNFNLYVGDITKGEFSISGLDPTVTYTLELVNS